MLIVTKHNGHDDTLSLEHAAVLLGCSPRTVRRHIAAGRLAGTTHPCSTTKAAVDAYRLAQQGVSGEVLPPFDNAVSTRDKSRSDDTMAMAFTAALAELGRAREQVAALAREVGRREAEALALERQVEGLHAQLDDLRCHEGERGWLGQHNGHRGSALARLGPWLRR